MAKKISALFLALVLCLTAMVVPVSAAAELNGTPIAFALEWDKDYYEAGDTAKLYLYMAVQEDVELNYVLVSLGLNSAYISPDDNDPASCVAQSEVSASFFSDITTVTNQSIATYQTKIEGKNTAEENATYDWYVRTALAKNANGTHDNALNKNNGLAGSEIDPSEPFITYTFTVAETAPDGEAIPAGLPSGALSCSPAQIQIKYYKTPGSAQTTAIYKATDIDISKAVATAKIGEDPCANGHPSTTATEEVITAETCTAAGLKKVTYTCTVCGKVDKTEEVEIPAAHKYVAEVTAPTCTEAGYTTYTCSACGNNYTADEVVALGHTAAEAVVENEVAATCKDDGSYDSVVYCSVCDAELSRETVPVSATGAHVYATIVDEKAATCTDDGYVTKACGCGERETTVVPAAGHSYNTEVTAPTCTEDGYTTYTCACGDTYTDDEVSATGHTDGEEVVEKEVAATCTTDGSYDTVVYCSVCGTELSRETTTVDALGHSYTTEVTAPTCTAEGYTTYTCIVCGDTKVDDTVEALGHSYETEVTAPTCTADGYTTYTCTVCGDTYTGDEVAAAGHDYEVDFVKNATCSKDGYTRYKCAVCGDKYTETIASKKHTNEDGSSALVEIPAVAPTCKNHGYTAGSKCTLCNSTVDTPKRVEATGHTKVDGVVTEPTYFEGGYTTYTCPVCGEVFEDDHTEKIAVDFTFAIAEPSTTTLRARDTIVLHPEFKGEVAEGVSVVWTADNENFKMVENEDGTVTVESKKNGTTVFTATVYDAEGNEMTSDTVELTSNAKFFQRLAGFFRVLFKKTINYVK